MTDVEPGQNTEHISNAKIKLMPFYLKPANSAEEYVKDIVDANNLTGQLKAIKQAFELHNDNSHLLNYFAEMFFEAPLNHPIRNVIARLCERYNNVPLVDEVFSASIASNLNRVSISMTSLDWNKEIVSLQGYFINFPMGIRIMRMNAIAILSIASDSLLLVYEALEFKKLTLTERNKHLTFLHNVMRLLTTTLPSVKVSDLQITSITFIIVESICRLITMNSTWPADLKTTAGIIIAYTAKQYDRFSDLIEEATKFNLPKHLPLIYGIINFMDDDCFVDEMLQVLKLCTIVQNIVRDHQLVPNIILMSARVFDQVVKKIKNFKNENLDKKTIGLGKLIIRVLLMYAVNYIDYSLDGVRYTAREILKTSLINCKRFEFDLLVNKFYAILDKEPMDDSKKCCLLTEAINAFGANAVVRKYPGIFPTMFKKYLGRIKNINSLYLHMMQSAHVEMNYEQWLKVWFKFLIREGVNYNIDDIISKSILFEKRLIPIIMLHEDVHIKSKLSLLHVIRKTYNRSQLPTYVDLDDMLKGFYNDMIRLMLSSFDSQRIIVLRLVSETRKTQEEMQIFEAYLIDLFLKYNIGCPIPMHRQEAARLLIKCINRLEVTIKNSQIKNFKHGLPDTDPKSIYKFWAVQFLRHIMARFTKNFFPSANYNRRFLSLEMLCHLMDLCLRQGLNFNKMLPPDAVPRYAAVLNDNYESNKVIALKLINKLSQDPNYKGVKRFIKSLNAKQIMDIIMSMRPADTLTGAYYLDLYASYADMHTATPIDLPVTYLRQYYAITWCLTNLKEGIKQAQIDLTIAVKVNPLHGLLFAVNHLLAQTNFKELATEVPWRKLIRELIDLCMVIAEIVEPIVRNVSPEGYMPNEPEMSVEVVKKPPRNPDDPIFISLDILSQRYCRKKLLELKTTSQMVLLCAWRSIKQISLMLGNLVKRAPVQLNITDKIYLLTKEQTFKISMLFRHLLTVTRHRGAFEQLSVGFSMICTRLWKIDFEVLNTSPLNWLYEIFFVLIKPTGDSLRHVPNITATRRSAGIPFMVQALVTSEMTVGTSNTLNFTMTNLLKMCMDSNALVCEETRTHALNIMRALYRSSELSESMAIYLSDGVRVAIDSYCGGGFMQRNAAALLFSALVQRIFGVQHDKDWHNPSIRNRMTSESFFLKYPQLYAYAVKELKSSYQSLSTGRRYDKIHMLLLLLGRLYPSSNEMEVNFDTHVSPKPGSPFTETMLSHQIQTLVPAISISGAGFDLPTRILTAKTIVAIAGKSFAFHCLCHIMSTFLNMVLNGGNALENFQAGVHIEKPTSNEAHGLVLQAYYLLRAMYRNKNLYSDAMMRTLKFISEAYTAYFKNPIIMTTLIDCCLVQLFNLNMKNTCEYLLVNLTAYVNKFARTVRYNRFYPLFNKHYYIYVLTVQSVLSASPMVVIDSLLELSPDCDFDVIETKINIILLFMKDFALIDDVDLYDIDFEDMERMFVERHCEEDRKNISERLSQDTSLQMTLMEYAKDPTLSQDFIVKSYIILSILSKFTFHMKYLLRVSEESPLRIRAAVALCILRFHIRYKVLHYKRQFAKMTKYVLSISSPDNPDYLRIRAVNFLNVLAPAFKEHLQQNHFELIPLFSFYMYLLLSDDCKNVRVIASHTTMTHLTNNVVLIEKFVNWMNEIPSPIKFFNEHCTPSYTQALFLQFIVGHLKSQSESDTKLLTMYRNLTHPLIQLIQMRNLREDYNSTDDIYEHPDDNVYAEPLTVFRAVGEIFKQNFTERYALINAVICYERFALQP